MDSIQQLAQRIQQLERANRRMKIFGGIALVGTLCLAAATPYVCDVVTGERLVLRDSSGRSRITMNAYNTETPALEFQSKEGRTTGSLTISDDGIANLSLYDAKGKARGTYRWGDEPKTPTAAPAKADNTAMLR